MANLDELLKPVVLVNRKDKTKKLVIGHVSGVNDRYAIKAPFKLKRGEIGALFCFWCSRAASVYAVFDAGQSGSTEIRLLPYAENRMSELSEYLDEKFMCDTEEAWFSNHSQPTHEIEPVNPEEFITIPVSHYELIKLHELQESATEKDSERIFEIGKEIERREKK